MKILIKSISENPFFVEVDEDATIMVVKSAIFTLNKIYPIYQTLVYQGQILSNQTTLQSIGLHLKKNPTLYYVLSKEYRDRTKKTQTQNTKHSNFFNSANRYPQSASSPKRISIMNLFSNQNKSPCDDYSEDDQEDSSCFDSILEHLMEKSPQYKHALKDRESIYETYQAYSDPLKRLELAKSSDRFLNLADFKGALLEVAQMQKNLQEALEEALSKYKESLNPEWYAKMNKTVIPDKPLTNPSEDPIEMDFVSNNFWVNLLQYQMKKRLSQVGFGMNLMNGKNSNNMGLLLLRLMFLLHPKADKPSPNPFHSKISRRDDMNDDNLRSRVSFDEDDDILSIDNDSYYDSSDDEFENQRQSNQYELFDVYFNSLPKSPPKNDPFLFNNDDVVSLSPRRKVKHSTGPPKYKQIFHNNTNNKQKTSVYQPLINRDDDECFFDLDLVEQNTKLYEERSKENQRENNWKLIYDMDQTKDTYNSSDYNDDNSDSSDSSDFSID